MLELEGAVCVAVENLSPAVVFLDQLGVRLDLGVAFVELGLDSFLTTNCAPWWAPTVLAEAYREDRLSLTSRPLDLTSAITSSCCCCHQARRDWWWSRLSIAALARVEAGYSNSQSLRLMLLTEVSLLNFKWCIEGWAGMWGGPLRKRIARLLECLNEEHEKPRRAHATAGAGPKLD